MTIPGLLAGLFTLWAPGFGLTLILLRGNSRINFLECAALGWLFGGGVISLLLCLGGFVFSGPALQSSVTIAALALAVFGWHFTRSAQSQIFLPRPKTPLQWFLAGAIALEILLMFYASTGHGLGWDGLINWEVKARYAYFHDGVIPAEYYRSETRAFTHPAYPLLIPMTELWLYLWMGDAQQFWIKLIFPFYYAALAILLAAAIRRLTSERWPALTASALLFFVPFLSNSPGNASGGYVDVPLSALYFVTIAYLLVYTMNGRTSALRIYAASLALLPWAKREGAVLWLIAGLCGAFVLWRKASSPRSYFLMLPGLVIMAAWKIFLRAMHTREAREFMPMSLATLREQLPRLVPIVRMVSREMIETTRWSLFWPAVIFAFACLVWRMRDRRLLVIALSVAAPIFIYAATYLFSVWPDYTLHFEASFSRLLAQVMPVAWLAIALAWPTRRPNEF